MVGVGVDFHWAMAKLLNVIQTQHGGHAAQLMAIVAIQKITVHAMSASTIGIQVSLPKLGTFMIMELIRKIT